MRIEDATAAEVMTTNVQTLEEGMDMREALTLLQDLGVSGAPVVDETGKLVGVLTQTDILTYYRSREDQLVSEMDYYQRASLEGVRVASGYEILDTNVARVRDAMSPITITAAEDTPVRDIARLMVGKQIHRIIVAREGRVAGIVSALDLLKIFFR